MAATSTSSGTSPGNGYLFERVPSVHVDAPNTVYTDDAIKATFAYRSTSVSVGPDGAVTARPVEKAFAFETARRVPKTGVMIVGLGGNNGTTVAAGIIANRKGLSWMTKEGKQSANYFGSVTQASSVRLGLDDTTGRDVFVPFSALLPMVQPNDLVVGGWDISKMPLGDAMRRAKVLPYDLQRQLYDELQAVTPLPSIYYPDFIAANQADRADNLVAETTKQGHLDRLRADIRAFKAANALDKVIVLWSANTERYADLVEGLNDTGDHVLAAIARGEAEVSASTVFAVAAILEGCTYINGSPQNTFVPGVVQLAEREGVYIGGDDFKSGQTKMKSVLVDFLVSSGIKPVSIVSYNHLGNNDGKNLSAPKQFRSKEISKSNVVDDMVASNGVLYDHGAGEHPDHTVVIKYVPYVGDSKRALDEYTSEIFLGGKNTIAMHNTCEDSLLAAPLIIDLVLLAELAERITINGQRMHCVLSLLSFLLKAPLVPRGAPVVNALFAQRQCITNLLRAAVGLAPENHLALEHRLCVPGTQRLDVRLSAAASVGGGAAPAAVVPTPIRTAGGGGAPDKAPAAPPASSSPSSGGGAPAADEADIAAA